ncbi:MAG: hypothetical protein WB543_03765 [Candidatus Acidiferrum sp.]
MTWLVRGLALGGGLLFVSLPSAVGQTESTLAIRVQSDQALVPTFVLEKKHWHSSYPPAGVRCLEDNGRETRRRSKPSVRPAWKRY